MSTLSKGRLREAFLQGLQMPENRLKLIRQCPYFIWKESLIERRVSASVSVCSVWLERFRFHHTPKEFGLQANKNLCTLFGTPHLNSFQCGVAALWHEYDAHRKQLPLKEVNASSVCNFSHLANPARSVAAGQTTTSYSRLRISCLNIPETCTEALLGNLSNRQNTGEKTDFVYRGDWERSMEQVQMLSQQPPAWTVYWN